MERKPVDKLKFSELKNEAVYLNQLLEKKKDFRGYTILQLQTDVRKWRAEADSRGIYNYNPQVPVEVKPVAEVKETSDRSTTPLVKVAPKKSTKDKKKKKNNTRTLRPMGGSDTLSADIIRMHEEGKSVMQIYASDPVRFKYNTVYMIIKRYKARQKKLNAQKQK